MTVKRRERMDTSQGIKKMRKQRQEYLYDKLSIKQLPVKEVTASVAAVVMGSKEETALSKIMAFPAQQVVEKVLDRLGGLLRQRQQLQLRRIPFR